MLIENKGIQTDTFHIPPFSLNSREFMVLFLYGGAHFHQTKTFLGDIFSGKIKDANVMVHKNLTFVEHYTEPLFRRLFHPVTVGEFLKKTTNPDSPYATKIYEINGITEKTRINTLPNHPKRLLSLYAAFSKTDHIVFDLLGQGPAEAKKIYQTVNEFVKEGGSAILLDNFNDQKNDCTKYIELQWLK
ncbi:hypothetical protein DRF65_08425 [Chryseobacterium pennae]|uniref:Uncharacterized protein n=1 Tax=Chryseobacterium pennae TaxID=2258962 RepID=A0A3D9CAU1_9FLAO|nr:hypothetical protein [Chryseobacterium pennae]REC62838.1 hypothetical protein DRF65_08425 [Chryseobacterium pennae]